MPTIILGAAALIAAASAAVAVLRSDGDRPPEAAPVQGAAKPDQPGAATAPSVAELQARLDKQPNDPVGWRLLGSSLYEAGDLTRSAAAYRKAAEIEPGNADNWSSLGEALQTASAAVQPEAARAFERAVKIDPADPRARYFLAVQKDMGGQHEAAIADWIALLKDTPSGAPWEADLRRTIEQVATKNKIDIAGRVPAPAGGSGAANAAIPGPTREQMAAASSVPPGQQSEMVKAMVERLANRLKQNPKDADGWVRLMRARMVLGERDGAAAALRSGLAAFQGDAAAQTQLNRAADELGVPRGG